MHDLIPKDRTGRYFGWRKAIATFVGVMLTLAAGIGMEVATATSWRSADPSPDSTCTARLAGCSSGCSCRARPNPGCRAMFRRVYCGSRAYRERKFRMLLFFAAAWSFAI